MTAKIRKIAVNVEETHSEMGRNIAPPTRKAVAVAVIENPFAGVYQEDLSALMDIGAELGALLGDKCVAALGITPAQAQSYGKSAMVGENGELEHAAAILHPKLGAPLRAAVEKGAALVASSKKMGSPGQVLDVPLGHKDAAYVRSHFDGIEVCLNDAPRANEIMVAVAVTDSGRPLPRVGGLTHDEAEGKDGLR
ncbi:amino acid synthesis family protein [Sulfitobacter mediterraneus]|jgi:amino acid synthesis protein|uniref:amino acid synthesis family protein n=1 Tax=Sulfitobacter TaxID=60136 RepID=UPI001932F3B9|nr:MULTISPECIES: amino acid synthesis family protein [Sulfitobacter]MBM1635068.1 amino acid synthesis family protein [Sulfitobacter mediterraneus]MBM1642845.1 amino acid synthesis family protein [Sulfitobacter mediterraneus]MBM1646874.1 amino acid synthesis family protein [Sulfitobacter mediterraneus]MBM1650953.1 amino acid synthesis family protein [Sulfitobacter mediterraneus]MBM1654984.1 amino acid synthesis family protein [Sulfitobacter mediterraneus]